jgi:hypothetical protein
LPHAGRVVVSLKLVPMYLHISLDLNHKYVLRTIALLVNVVVVLTVILISVLGLVSLWGE